MNKKLHKLGGLATALVLATTIAVPATSSAQTACTAFVRDLTVGSTGSDVVSLQTYLEETGYLTIPAGTSKGYFGTLTKTALARYQAAKAIAPAAGYFGPLTRAKVTAECASTPSTPSNPSNPSNNSSELKGGEANLTKFDLKREDASGAEGESEVEVATAVFDVEDGDVRIERIELTASSTKASASVRPWDYFDRVIVSANGKEIADMDVDDRRDWSENSKKGIYTLTLTGLKHIVREGDKAELTFAFDINDNIDSDDMVQEFDFSISDRGIRGRDAEGIQQYVGKSSDTVRFGFETEQNGDLSVRSNKDNPAVSTLVSDRNRESKSYEVFAFDIRNSQKADSTITDLTIGVEDLNSGVLASDVIRKATLVAGREKFSGDIHASTISFDDMDFDLDGDDTQTFFLQITLARNATGTPISFSLEGADVEAEGVASGNETEVDGQTSSKVHTIGVTGVNLASGATSMRVVTPGSDASATYGEYSIKFNLTALEDDAFIAASASSTGIAGVSFSIDGATAFVGNPIVSLTSTARKDNGFYIVEEGDEETFTLTVTLNPEQAGQFGVQLESVRFNSSANLNGSTVLSFDQNNANFKTGVQYIAN